MNSAVAQKLLKSFMHFNRAYWQQKEVLEYKNSEVMMLMCIKKNDKIDSPGLMVSEISHLLQVTSPTVTQLLKGMEKKELIERNLDQVDRRVVRIKLTDQGKLITEQAEAAFRASFSGLIEHLGEEESNQLADLLAKAYLFFKESSR
ncbi:MAG: MarR family transcriptional regulator [Paenibacillaceae bacterium]